MSLRRDLGPPPPSAEAQAAIRDDGGAPRESLARSVDRLFDDAKVGKTDAKRIVLTVTGHGLKDSDTAMTTGDYRPHEAEADLSAIRAILEAGAPQ